MVVGNTIHNGVYPLYKAPDQGDVLLRQSATPAIRSPYLPNLCAAQTLGWWYLVSNLRPFEQRASALPGMQTLE